MHYNILLYISDVSSMKSIRFKIKRLNSADVPSTKVSKMFVDLLCAWIKVVMEIGAQLCFYYSFDVLSLE